MEDECSYYRRRAAEERSSALTCNDPVARQVHEDMAARYEGLASAACAFEHYLDHEAEAVS